MGYGQKWTESDQARMKQAEAQYDLSPSKAVSGLGELRAMQNRISTAVPEGSPLANGQAKLNELGYQLGELNAAIDALSQRLDRAGVVVAYPMPTGAQDKSGPMPPESQVAQLLNQYIGAVTSARLRIRSLSDSIDF